MFDMLLRVTPLLVPLVYPIYVLMMATVLRTCGVPRKEIAKWALRQAGRQRLTDLIRAARGLDSVLEASPAEKDVKAVGAGDTSSDEVPSRRSE